MAGELITETMSLPKRKRNNLVARNLQRRFIRFITMSVIMIMLMGLLSES